MAILRRLKMTLKIIKGQVSKLTVTLSELADASLPNIWLFVFKKDQGEQVYKTFLEDISEAEQSYNQVLINDPLDVNFMTGDYGYKVYQMPDEVDTNEARGVLVEIGKARVEKNATAPASFRINKERKSYEK